MSLYRNNVISVCRQPELLMSLGVNYKRITSLFFNPDICPQFTEHVKKGKKPLL